MDSNFESLAHMICILVKEGFYYTIGLQKFNDKNINQETKIFIKYSITNISIPNTGSSHFSPIGDSFIDKETSAIFYGHSGFCSFERTGTIQISQLEIYYNRF